MSAEPIDPAAVMAAHGPSDWWSEETGHQQGPPYSLCISDHCGDPGMWPCEPYRLAEALAAEQAKAADYAARLEEVRRIAQAEINRLSAQSASSGQA